MLRRETPSKKAKKWNRQSKVYIDMHTRRGVVEPSVGMGVDWRESRDESYSDSEKFWMDASE